MLNKEILSALNKQFSAELGSAYLYLSMSSYFESKNLKGFASWMRFQAKEELSHAMKIFEYVADRGERISMSPIQKPKEEWASPVEAIKDVFEHEKEITKGIDELVSLAISKSDYATNNFLQFFVSEQVEEESTAMYIYEKAKLALENPMVLFMLDRELAERKQ